MLHFNIHLFIYLWLCWVFVSVRGLSLVAASGGHSSSRCAGLSPSRPLLLRSTGSRRAGSVVVAHGPSCSAACGILPDQGSNPRPLHWQAVSQPLRHQGSPDMLHFKSYRPPTVKLPSKWGTPITHPTVVYRGARFQLTHPAVVYRGTRFQLHTPRWSIGAPVPVTHPTVVYRGAPSLPFSPKLNMAVVVASLQWSSSPGFHVSVLSLPH